MEPSKIEKYINETGEFIATPVGTSMWPMLRNRRDTVYLVKPEGRLKKYDLPVYRRSDGTHVMHRCIKVLPDSYVMCGDHQFIPEHGVKDSQVIAVAKGFYRDEKYISCDNPLYKLYYHFWCMSLFLRRVMLKIMHIFVPYQKTWELYKKL